MLLFFLPCPHLEVWRGHHRHLLWDPQQEPVLLGEPVQRLLPEEWCGVRLQGGECHGKDRSFPTPVRGQSDLPPGNVETHPAVLCRSTAMMTTACCRGTGERTTPWGSAHWSGMAAWPSCGSGQPREGSLWSMDSAGSSQLLCALVSEGRRRRRILLI